MKCICVRTCQIRINGKIVLMNAGMVDDFEECPKHFMTLEGDGAKELDFLTANEAELMAFTWTFVEANKVIKDKYGKELKKEEGTLKSDVVAQILDIRFRALDMDPNKVV